jgi:predicted nucleotidyltransferase
MKPLLEALHELVELFDRLNIDYAIMGGIAVRVHGIARPTQDIDLVVSLERDRLADLFDEVEALGYTVPETYRTGWVDNVAGMPLVKLRRYIGEHGLDVDVFIADSPFQEGMLQRATLVEIDGFQGRVISSEDLILLKLKASRHRDLADVLDILFIQGRVDEEYLRHWASKIGVAEQLEQLLNEWRET